MLQRTKWATYRILFIILGFMCAATGGVLAFVLGPLMSYLFFRDLKFWKYKKYLLLGSLEYWNILYKMAFNKGYNNMFQLALTSPPMSGPDLKKVKLSKDWNAGAFDCNQCVKCCEAIKCPLLDRTTNLCTSYQSFFWRYFPCGRYPMTKAQIDFYGCPKWTMADA